jgi:hypothetical protein
MNLIKRKSSLDTAAITEKLVPSSSRNCIPKPTKKCEVSSLFKQSANKHTYNYLSCVSAKILTK